MQFQLRHCVWEITLACCFSCKYCGSKAGKARSNELTTSECINVVDQLADLGCERVSLIGGEVFMRSDRERIADALHIKGIRTSIITNGYNFSSSVIESLHRTEIESVAISLDSIREVHDSNRQAGSFERAEKAIIKLADASIPVSVISTLNKESADHIEEFYQWLINKPIFAWQIQACSPMGNANARVIPHRKSVQAGLICDKITPWINRLHCPP